MKSAWTEAVDRLLAAFAHDANGRTGSVQGLLALVEDGAPSELWLPLLRDEVRRLERHGGALRAVAPDLGPDPLDIRDILALTARALDTMHIRLVPPEVSAGEVVAVHASRTALVRALLIALLVRIEEGGEVTVRTRLERRGDQVVLRLAAEPAHGAAVPAEAQSLVAPYGGSMSASAEHIMLTMPALDS